jgi:hypothetical protein
MHPIIVNVKWELINQALKLIYFVINNSNHI